MLVLVHGSLGHVRLAGTSCERRPSEAAADARPQAPRRRHRGPHLAEALSFHSTSSTAGRRGRRWRAAAKHTRLQLDCKAVLPSLSVMLSAACAGQASLQSVKSWLFGPLWLKRSCRKTTFRTTSERPGVHENVAVHMILRTVRGHEACFRLCSCSAHIAVCSFAAILSSWQDNVLCRASLDLQRHERGQKSMF